MELIWTIVAASVAVALTGYAGIHVKTDGDEDDDEIVERTRLNIIVKWPR